MLAAEPLDRGVVAPIGDQTPARLADRGEGVVAQVAARQGGDGLVEQFDELAQEPRLALAARAEQEQVVAGEDGVNHLGQYRVVVADQAGQDRLAPAELAEEVAPHLLLDRDGAVARRAERADGLGEGHRVVSGEKRWRGKGISYCPEGKISEDFACLDGPSRLRYEGNTLDPPRAGEGPPRWAATDIGSC